MLVKSENHGTRALHRYLLEGHNITLYSLTITGYRPHLHIQKASTSYKIMCNAAIRSPHLVVIANTPN